MQATVKVDTHDFNLDIFEKIKSFAQNGEFGEIVITFRAKNKKKASKMTKEAFSEKIDHSVKQVEAGEFVVYSAETFLN